MRIIVLLFLMCSILHSNVYGMEDVPVAVVEIPTAFVFDGKVTPGEWDDVKPLDLIVQTPVYRGTPTERTVIRLAHDEDYIYLSGALYDSDMKKGGTWKCAFHFEAFNTNSKMER